MTKRILISFFAGVLLISATACSALLSTTKTYLNAFTVTRNADSFQSHSEIICNLDLSKAPEDIKKDFENMKEFKVNIDELADNKNKKAQVDLYVSIGDFSMNTRIYSDGNEVHMKYGDKYILINPDEYGKPAEKAAKSYNGYGKLFEDMLSIWKSSIENEVLAKEGDTIVYTPDGDMKVTQLSLELIDDKTKNILTKISDSISKNENLKKAFLKSAMSYRPKDITEEKYSANVKGFLDNLPEKLLKAADSFKVNQLKLTARIDKDSYIIDQNLLADITIKLKNGVIGINCSDKTTKWDFNKKMKIDIPKFSKEDVETIEEFNMKNFSKDFQDSLLNK